MSLILGIVLLVFVLSEGASNSSASSFQLPAQPSSWTSYVNQPQTEGELAAIRRSLARGQPYGGERWVQTTAKRLGLESTLRRRGRPFKRKPTLRSNN